MLMVYIELIKKIIMERPQKFEAVRIQYLHGIDNTGWEYKSFDELVSDWNAYLKENYSDYTKYD